MNLPLRMFEAGYTIEEIIYYIGIDIKLLTNYIPNEIIVAEGKKRLSKTIKQPVHPFKCVVDEFYNNIIECSE